MSGVLGCQDHSNLVHSYSLLYFYFSTNGLGSAYDCLVIPNASTVTAQLLTFSEFCGSEVTFADFMAATEKTVCCKFNEKKTLDPLLFVAFVALKNKIFSQGN